LPLSFKAAEHNSLASRSVDEPELFHLFAFRQQAREPDPNTCVPSLVLRASGEWLGCRHAAEKSNEFASSAFKRHPVMS
jgi:hypothetical protein